MRDDRVKRWRLTCLTSCRLWRRPCASIQYYMDIKISQTSVNCEFFIPSETILREIIPWFAYSDEQKYGIIIVCVFYVWIVKREWITLSTTWNLYILDYYLARLFVYISLVFTLAWFRHVFCVFDTWRRCRVDSPRRSKRVTTPSKTKRRFKI